MSSEIFELGVTHNQNADFGCQEQGSKLQVMSACNLSGTDHTLTTLTTLTTPSCWTTPDMDNFGREVNLEKVTLPLE